MKKLIIMVLFLTGYNLMSQTLVPFLKNNGKYIFVENKTMKPILNQEFDSRPELFFGDYIVVIKADKSILIDKKGKAFLTNFDRVEGYKYGVAIVVSNNKRGLANINGSLLLQPKYDRIWFVSENFLVAQQGDQYDLIDKSGKKAFPVKYDKIEPIDENCLKYIINGKCGIIDNNGNVLTQPVFSELELISGFSCGLVKAESDGLIGFKNKSNNLVIPFINEKGEDFHEGLAFVKPDAGKGGYIDTMGRMIFYFKGSIQGSDFSEGMARMRNYSNTFFIDNKGNIKLIFENAEYDRNELVKSFSPVSIEKSTVVTLKGYNFGISEDESFGTGEGFHQGLLAVYYYKGGSGHRSCAFINTSGEFVIPVKVYGFVAGFKNGYAILSTYNGQEFYIDTEGREYKDSIADESMVYASVDESPSYPGGEAALYKFISENIVYPKEAKGEGIQGKVSINFIVEANGKLTNFSILRGIGSGCDEEAIRIIKAMPDWIPGKLNGKQVRTRFNVGVKFKL